MASREGPPIVEHDCPPSSIATDEGRPPLVVAACEARPLLDVAAPRSSKLCPEPQLKPLKVHRGVESREGCTSSKTVDYIAVKQARREDNSLHSHKEQNVLLKGIVDGGKLWHQSPQCNSLRWE
ncbi:hypothetical protein Dimus_011453 [Dionaea muscipula]